MCKQISIWLIIATLTGCSLIPEQGPAPKQLQLQSFSSPAQSQPLVSKPRVPLILERPLAPAALMSRSLWYQTHGHELMPFRDHLWTQPLVDQLQLRLEDYLAQRLPDLSVQRDQPGSARASRLRLHLYDWHLDVERQSLYVNLQAFLLDPQGVTLAQWRWQGDEPLTENSAPALVQAGQVWLERWSEELAVHLARFFAGESDPE